jgi:hypothetical protein
MRFVKKPIPKRLDSRVKHLFALFPITAFNRNKGVDETRWLERVVVTQIYKHVPMSGRDSEWVNECFIDEDE